MRKIYDLEKLYKNNINIEPIAEVEENSFTSLTLLFNEKVGHVFDSLAYIAGIKSAPADSKCNSLDMTNLQSLLASAQLAGYDVPSRSLAQKTKK